MEAKDEAQRSRFTAASGFDNSTPGAVIALAFVLGCLCFATGCDRMTTPRNTQLAKDADAKAADGDYLRAIGLYEQALDGSAGSAEVHYRLAMLYDDKVNDPLNALHHFKRYLSLDPNGKHASDAKNFMKRDELALLTSLSGDSLVTRGEAARLRNENFLLRKELEEERLRTRNLGSAADKATIKERRIEKATAAGKKGMHPRTYVVQSGDTLASISRKFYKSSSHWKEILAANHQEIENPARLRVGQTLILP